MKVVNWYYEPGELKTRGYSHVEGSVITAYDVHKSELKRLLGENRLHSRLKATSENKQSLRRSDDLLLLFILMKKNLGRAQT